MLLIANTHKDYKDVTAVTNLIKAGVDIIRFNLSYGSVSENIEKLNTARAVIKRNNSSSQIMADLPGNKIRIKSLKSNPLILKSGQEVYFSGDNKDADIVLPVNNIESYVRKNDEITYKDGELAFRVVDIRNDGFIAEALNDYEVVPNKGINIGRAIDQLNHITSVTIEQIEVINSVKPEYVAFSFVNSRQSIIDNKKLLFSMVTKGYKPVIVAKIESQKGIDNIVEIAKECDLVMVARGDLGLNTPISHLGINQKLITKQVKSLGKKVIVATQILDSLLYNHIPLRGEVLDLTNIVLDQVDGIMFSCTSSTKDASSIISSARSILDSCIERHTKNIK
jgi:pyruvate kinase